MTELPESWTTVKIPELLIPNDRGKPFTQGWSPQCEAQPAAHDEWGVLKTTAIQNGKFLDYENKRLPDDLDPKPNLEVQTGDIIMTCAGPRSRCGIACLVKNTRTRLLISGKMYKFNGQQSLVDSKYLEAFLLSKEATDAIDRMKTGISDSGLNLTQGRFAELDVPLAPRNEQRRIVARIEELFSELDKGVENLQTARDQLGVYRQAVLKHALEGRLTEKWREENSDKLETVDMLLERVKEEQEKRFADEIAKWNEAVITWEEGGKDGKKPSKPRKPGQVEPFSKAELKVLPKVPPGWIWQKLADLSSKITDGEHFRPMIQKEGVFFLSAKDVRESGVSFDDPLYVDEPTAFKARLRCDPQRGDILIVSRGATVGRMCIVKTDQTFCLLGSVILIKVADSICSPFLLGALKSPRVNRDVTSSSGSTAQQAIYLRDIKHVAIPVCSRAEQEKIAALLEEAFERSDELEAAINAEIERSKALHQAILKRAFSGHLVDQDSNDEPASELLSRMMAREKEHENAKKRTTRKDVA